MKHNFQTISAICFDYGCPREVANEILACKREIVERIQDLTNRSEKLPIPSEERPELVHKIEILKEILGET